MKKYIEKLEGIFTNKDYISPAYMSLKNPKYVEIDGMYYTGIIFVNYNRENTDLILKKIIDTNINMNISIFYEKQDNYKAVRNLTYNIANVGVDLKDGKTNATEVDIAAFTYNDAKYIRKEIQVNNEDIYFLYIYLNIFSNNEKELEYLLNKIEGIVESNGIQVRRANFRQNQLILSTFPFMINSEDLKPAAKRNILTTGLTGTYPFISTTIFDEKGIFYGTNIYNESLEGDYKNKVVININCKENISDLEKQDMIDIIRRNFGIQVKDLLYTYEKEQDKKAILLVVGIALIILYYTGFASVLKDVILMFGWLAICSSVYGLIFSSTEIYVKIKRLKNLSKARIYFDL